VAAYQHGGYQYQQRVIKHAAAGGESGESGGNGEAKSASRQGISEQRMAQRAKNSVIGGERHGVKAALARCSSETRKKSGGESGVSGVAVAAYGRKRQRKQLAA